MSGLIARPGPRRSRNSFCSFMAMMFGCGIGSGGQCPRAISVLSRRCPGCCRPR